MIKNSKYLSFVYSEKDNKYIEELIESLDFEIERVLKFFNIKNNEKIVINLFEDVEKLWNLHDKLYKTRERYGEVPNWICGFSVNNNVYTVCLEELKKTYNKQDSDINTLRNLILHETIHSIHSFVNKDTLNITWLSEGLATTLSHQYDNVDNKFDATISELEHGNCYYYNYHSFFSYLLEKYGRDYILNLINNYSICNEELQKKYDEVTKFYDDKTKIK